MFSPRFPPRIDSGNDDVGLFLQQRVERQNHRVGRRAFDGKFALGDLVAIDRLAQRERLRRGAALVRRRHDRDVPMSLVSAATSARSPGA